MSWIAELLFTPAVSTVKASILVFYLRLSSKSHFRLVGYAGLVWIGLWFVAFEVVTAAVCGIRSNSLFNAVWDRDVE